MPRIPYKDAATVLQYRFYTIAGLIICIKDIGDMIGSHIDTTSSGPSNLLGMENQSLEYINP